MSVYPARAFPSRRCGLVPGRLVRRRKSIFSRSSVGVRDLNLPGNPGKDLLAVGIVPEVVRGTQGRSFRLPLQQDGLTDLPKEFVRLTGDRLDPSHQHSCQVNFRGLRKVMTSCDLQLLGHGLKEVVARVAAGQPQQKVITANASRLSRRAGGTCRCAYASHAFAASEPRSAFQNDRNSEPEDSGSLTGETRAAHRQVVLDRSGEPLQHLIPLQHPFVATS